MTVHILYNFCDGIQTVWAGFTSLFMVTDYSTLDDIQE